MAPIPAFYNPERVGTLFYPDVESIAADAAQAGLVPAADDVPRVCLLLIDMQVDFCHETGALYVPGAQDDIRRVLRLLYANAERISQIICSLDTHYPFQIFHAAWWVGPDERHPAPFTVITAADVAAGVWRPVRENEWSRHYVERLRQQAKKDLLVWPYHVPIGGVGQALDPELWSGVFWHAIARQVQPTFWTKGSLPQTEHYSILRPEVPVNDTRLADASQDFLGLLESFDIILLAGEAETHCVLETLRDLVDCLGDEPEKLTRIFVLKDCMSPVQHPQIDFHAQALEEFEQLAQRGLRFIESSDPLPFSS